MIDIHSHLIPKVDDGSKSIEETVKMLKEARKAGFTDVILTPHYMEGYYKTETEIIKIWTNQLQNVLANENIDINLYSGNETYITEELIELLNKNEVNTLANSRYLLLELPFNSKIKYLYEVLFTLKNSNIVPVIAHPERYTYIQENIEEAEKLVEQGCLLQCNYGSVIGNYGRKAKKTVKKLLKKDLVHFLGSDCHKPNTIYKEMKDIMKKLNKIISEEQMRNITVKNPKVILENREKLQIQ